MQINPLTSFILKVFLWLPVCYWCWYSSAEFVSIIITYLTELVINFSFPDLIFGVEQIGHNLEILVKATVPTQDMRQGMVAELPIPINPLIYNFGLPLCIALILSSPGSLLKTLFNCALSFLLLLPVQLWGICFDFMKTIFLQTPSHLINNFTLQPWQLELIGISYQIGTLVLPSVAPVIIWLFLYRNFVAQFIPSFPKK